MNEIRDSESNSDNSQIELLSNDEIRRMNNTRSVGRLNPIHSRNGVVCDNEKRYGTYIKHDEDDTSLERNSLLALNDENHDIEFADESQPSSPMKYMTHPNDYLPMYRSNGDFNRIEEGKDNDSQLSCPKDDRRKNILSYRCSDLANDNISVSILDFNPNEEPTGAVCEIEDSECEMDIPDTLGTTTLSNGRQSTFV